MHSFWLWIGACVKALTDLKQLHSDTGKHELEQRCDDHDVPDGPDGHKHALDHVLPRAKEQMFRYKPVFAAADNRDFIYSRQNHERTLSPLALLMALRGLNTLSTRRIFTTEIAEDLKAKSSPRNENDYMVKECVMS